MEAVFFRLHERFVITVARLLPARVRKYLEIVTLVNAFLLLAALIHLHIQFVNPKGEPARCLPMALARAGLDPSNVHVLQIHIQQKQGDKSSGHVVDRGRDQEREGRHCPYSEMKGAEVGNPFKLYSIEPGSGRAAVGTTSGPGTLGIAQLPYLPDTPTKQHETQDTSDVEVDSPSISNGSSDIPVSYYSNIGTSGESSTCSKDSGAQEQLTKSISPQHKLWDALVARATPLRLFIESLRCEDDGSWCLVDRSRWLSFGTGTSTECESTAGDRLSEGSSKEGTANGVTGAQDWVPDKVYLYSLEKGFLMLRQDIRAQHSIIATNITIQVTDKCFGSPVSNTILEHFIGYDTAVMNWLISLYGGKGFLYNVESKELFNLNYAAELLESTESINKYAMFKVGVVFTTLFLFFTTTTLVSFTLRETQERMLKFTCLLQHLVRNRQPYAPLVFTHVVESLVFVPIMVGILFFLFEFFSDQLLAFMVMSVVWMCEVYSVISVRTTTSIRFFPRVFFLYFAVFHIYFFSFPFGFSYLALMTTVLFLQHSMLFLWNRCEVPALRLGHVTVNRPRMGGVLSIRNLEPGRDRTTSVPARRRGETAPATAVRQSRRTRPSNLSPARRESPALSLWGLVDVDASPSPLIHRRERVRERVQPTRERAATCDEVTQIGNTQTRSATVPPPALESSDEDVYIDSMRGGSDEVEDRQRWMAHAYGGVDRRANNSLVAGRLRNRFDT